MALVTSAVIVAGAAVASYSQQRKSAKAQARANAAEQRRADIANARERRNAVRNARVQQASLANQAAITGTTGSSGVAGASANIQNQLADNLSFLDQNAALSAEASVANQQAADYASRASGYSAIGSAAGSAGSMYGGRKKPVDTATTSVQPQKAPND